MSMQITFTRRGNSGPAAAIAVRDDGTTIEIPGHQTGDKLPHDLVHYVVEAELELRFGFWGLLAAGAEFSNVLVVNRRGKRPSPRGRQLIREHRDDLVEAEALAGTFTAIWRGDARHDDDWPQVRARLANTWTHRPQRRPIGPADVERVCAALDALQFRWQYLPADEALTLYWPPGSAPAGRGRAALRPASGKDDPSDPSEDPGVA